MRRTVAQFFCWQRQSAAASAGDPSRATPNPDFAGCRHRLAPKCHSAGIAAHSRPRRSGSRDSGGQQDGTDATEAARSLSGPGPRPQRSGWLRPPYNFIVEGGKGARLERRARRGTAPAARASGNIGSAQPYNGDLMRSGDRLCARPILSGLDWRQWQCQQRRAWSGNAVARQFRRLEAEGSRVAQSTSSMPRASALRVCRWGRSGSGDGG